MRARLHPAFAAGRGGSTKWPSVALATLLLSSTAIGAVFTASSSAVAQTPPTPNPLQYGLDLIGAPTAWAKGYTGAGVTIAVGDTGIDTTHPAFTGKIDPRSMNFVLPAPGAPYDPEQITDLSDHGTHVSGIALASGTSDTPGVAFNANVVMLRVLAASSSCEAAGADCHAPGIPNASASALDYFAEDLNNVRIYNASYGPTLDKGTANLRTWPTYTIGADEEAAALNAISRGKIIVAANGNDRDTNPVAGLNPSGLALYPFIQPANANAGVYDDGHNNFNFSGLLRQSGLIIAVTAVGADKTIAAYAQMCGVTASWCVAAPGGNIPPEGTDPATTPGIYSTVPLPTTLEPPPDPPVVGYAFMQGTSMAAPMVSGALAVLTQAYPDYNAQDLAHVLFATAENIGGQAADNATYGYGLIRLDRAVAGLTSLAADSAVDVANQQMTYWSQPLTTDGAFSKTGTGYLIIAGRTTATGDATISSGALGVDGTLTLDAQMIVAQGATLAGFGTINGNTTINGTLNAGQLPNYSDLIANNSGTLPAGIPLIGTSPGTLTFNGNVTMGATATTRVNVDGDLQIPGGPGTYDKIIIDGSGRTFTANGTLTPILRGIPGGNNNYTPTIGTSFQFLEALDGASVTGGFVSLTRPKDGLPANARLDVIYAPTSIALNVTPLTFTGLAATQLLNANQQALAGALDRARPPAGRAMWGTEKAIFYALYAQNVYGDVAALTALSGQGQAATAPAILGAFAGFSDAIADRQAMLLSGFGAVQAALKPSIVFSYASTGPLAVARGATAVPFPIKEPPAAASNVDSPWTTWGQGYGRWSRVGEANGIPGARTTSDGFVVGTDRTVSSDLIAGGALSFTHTATDSANTLGTADTYAGAVYTTWMPGPLVFNGRLAAGPSKGGTSRSIIFPGEFTSASGSVNGWGALAAGDAGYRFDLPGATLKPFVGLTGQNFNRRAFTETADFGLSFPSQTFNRLTSEVGLWATTLFNSSLATFMLQLKVSWTNDFGNQALVTQAALLDQPFTIAAAKPGRDAAVVALNLTAWQTENLRLFANYRGEFRDNATSNQVSGGLRMTW